MAQLKNQNTHKMAPRAEKENGAILAGTYKAAWCWEKKWGETSAEDCKKYVIFRDIDGSTALF